MPLSTLAAALADLVLPRCCVGCGRAGRALCLACTPGGLLRLEVAGLPVVAAGAYAGALRAALIAYKERGRRDLAGPLGQLLVRSVAGGSASVLVLVPVPFIRSMGLGGLLIPVVSVAAALTLQPALLSLLGARAVGRRREGPSWSTSSTPGKLRPRPSPRR